MLPIILHISRPIEPSPFRRSKSLSEDYSRHSDLDELASLVPELDEMESILLDLSKASKDCSKAIQDRKLNMAMHDGLRKIPDEVLLRIFELGYYALLASSPSSPGTTRYAIRLTHVSRRFRAVAFKLPIFWSNISDKYGLTQANAFAQRSKQGPLNISFNECRTKTDLSEIIVRNAHRIEVIHSYSGDKKYKLVERLEKEAGNGAINFSRLHTLHLWNTETERDGMSIRLIAPRLESLKLRNMVPSITATSLVRMTYEIHSRNLQYQWSAAPLLGLIGSLPNLDALDLCIGQVREQVDIRYDTAVVSATKMRLIVNSEPVSHISSFLAALELPRLANLTVHIPGCYTTSFLRHLASERCPSLKKVKICLSSRNAPSRASATQIVLSCFPQIHHLILSNACFGDSTRQALAGISLNCLRTLVLSYCFVEETELLPLVEKLVGPNSVSETENASFKEFIFVDNCKARRFATAAMRSTDIEELGNVKRLLGKRMKVLTEAAWSKDPRNSWLYGE